MNLTEITFGKVKSQIESFLQQEYSKSGILFSNASPFGQILSVVENLYQMSFLYLKNSIVQYDLSDPSSLNSRVIRNAAIFAGHIPGRSISATGTLQITVKTDSDLQRDLPGGRITLSNRSPIKNKTNGLEYSLNLGTDRISYIITKNTKFFVPIIQGKWERKFFTGTGQPNQTYQVSVRGQLKEIENFNYEIIVNGEYWIVKKHIYDMIPDEKACVVRTGFDNGIDIIFGNGGFGMVPPIASPIEVNYLVSDGAQGSIFRRTINDWTFIEPPTDSRGNSVEIGNLFDISIYTDINFGADSETPQFTKNLLPISTNNFVLALPEQYAYQIKRLGVFSHVNAYELYGTIYIVATPNIQLFKNQNSNYFTIDIRAFELDSYEKSKVDLYLRTAGNIFLSKRYQIDSPILSYYVMNVYIITYSDAVDDNVNSQIYDTVSNYFLSFNRLDRIPKSDIISKLSSINEINSVDVTFVSRKNETYHIENPPDNTTTLGLDPILGDIVFEPSEIPIVRGGWYDRNGIFYTDDFESKGMKSINIIKKGTIDASKRQSI
jgi:hypothetical protein